MYTVEVIKAYGTGAPRHQYFTGTGLAMCRSVKKARKQAEAQADRNIGEGACWMPIWHEVVIRKNGMEISHTY